MRNPVDKLHAMAIFVRVVERGSFSAVAREMQTTQPTISKVLRALEIELSGKLIARSTRRLSLTDEGQRYYSECRQILAAVDAAEHSFQSGRETIAGHLRIGSSVSFGRLQIAPRLPAFLKRYPEIEIDLQLNDQNQDLVSEGLDVTFRIGPLNDSGLIARHIGTTHRVTVATPAYLKQHGQPQTPQQLSEHNCLLFNLLNSQNLWVYERDEQLHEVRIKGNAQATTPRRFARWCWVAGYCDVTGVAVQRGSESRQSDSDSARVHRAIASNTCSVPGESSPIRQGQSLCRLHEPGAASAPELQAVK
jgi:DNA-binding transcriptional LysR family regulator